MKIHITNLYGQAESSVAQIAQNIVSKTAKELGFLEIGMYSYPVHTDSAQGLSKRIDGMNAAVSNGDVVIIQSPSWNSTEFDDYYVEKLRTYQDIKIIIFIHDVIPLMFKSNEYLIDKTIETYNKADLLIVPSEKMLDELKKWGLKTKKIVIQHMWDHPTQLVLSPPKFNKLLHFSGSSDRFTFVKEWQFQTLMKYYGNESFNTETLNVTLEGWKNDSELLQALSHTGGFGLVWSQKSDVDYYEWNVSHKLSTYLAAGIPVVVQNTLSNKHLIEKNNLGIVVNSLEEANQKIQNLSEETYQNYVSNVGRFRQLIINNFFTKKILIDSVFSVMQE